MKTENKVKIEKFSKNENSEAKEFANQYMKNVIENQIKVMCPQCNMNTTIYPEHLGRSCCEKCNVLLEKVEDSKTKDEELKKGDRVKFRRVVDPDDDKIVMVLLEDPDGGRVLVESLIWDSLNPTRVLPTSELIKDSKTKDESMETQEFTKQYIKNITANQIEAMCPQCNMNTTIYPEHLDRAYCEKCNVLLEVVDIV